MKRLQNKHFNLILLFLAIGLVVLFYSVGGIFDTRVTSTPTFLPGFTGKPSPSVTPVISTSSAPTSTPSPGPTGSGSQIIKFIVPFTPQAPFGEWSDLRQEDGCEEATSLMAVYWARGQTLSLQEARDKILAISDWELANYGIFQDTSAEDTVDRIFWGYFKYQTATVADNISVQEIISELEKGNLVIVPVNGQLVHNPFYTAPGPERHMILIIGYDYQTQEFITNDPGTKRGQDYRYDRDVLFDAIRDFVTGNQLPILGTQRRMIVVAK